MQPAAGQQAECVQGQTAQHAGALQHACGTFGAHSAGSPNLTTCVVAEGGKLRAAQALPVPVGNDNSDRPGVRARVECVSRLHAFSCACGGANTQEVPGRMRHTQANQPR